MPGIAPVGSYVQPAPDLQSTKQAAQAFEAVLVRQMFKTMSSSIGKSGLFGRGFEQQLYQDMFSSAIADAASSSGLGMADMLEKAMDPDGAGRDSSRPVIDMLRGLETYRGSGNASGLTPSNTHLAAVFNGLVTNGSEQRWSPEGELSNRDLAADLVTEVDAGTAVFNVKDANGYQGHPKCNLFAFEMLRRAGFKVPIRARQRGWGYPGADSVTRMVGKGKVEGWARVSTGVKGEELDKKALAGQPYLLTSSAPGSKAGHMAVADQIHSIQRNESGEITKIEYSGWDAGNKGSQYGRKTWHLDSVSGSGRGGLDQIEILEPIFTGHQGQFEPIGSQKPGASVLDSGNERQLAQVDGKTTEPTNGT